MSPAEAAAGEFGAAAGDGCSLSIDWLEFSVKDVNQRLLLELMERHLGEEFGRKVISVLRDDERWFDAKGPHELRVRADRAGQENRHGVRHPWAGVRFPGAACRAAGTERLLELLAALEPFKVAVKVSRMDLALDDYKRAFTPRMFAEACVDGDLSDENGKLSARALTRVKPQNWDWSRRTRGAFWLGGYKSARLLRVYDKEAESKGAIAAVRVELQNRDHFATELAKAMLRAKAAGSPLAGVFVRHLLSFIDLREPSGPRSQSRIWKRLPWWQDLVGRARAAPTPKESATDVLAWERECRKQCRGFLQVELQAAGVSPADYAALQRHCKGRIGRLVGGLASILGPGMPALSGEHRERLRQLREVRRQAR